MFLLPPHLRRLLKRNKGLEKPRIYLQAQEMVTVVKKMARQQDRSEEEIISDFTKIGWDQFLTKNDMEERWDSLTDREQEVVALACLGYRNYEVAEILTIGPATVKTHLQNIFVKFNLHSRNELRLALKDWNFAKWWEDNHI